MRGISLHFGEGSAGEMQQANLPKSLERVVMLKSLTRAIVCASTLLMISATAMTQQDRSDGSAGLPITSIAVELASEAGQVIDLLASRPDNPQIKRACMLQIDGSNVPCDTVWYISFKDGAQSIQFNRGSGQNPIFSFFGKHLDVDIISIDGIALKVGEQSAQAKASGECILSKTKNAMGCQARIDDGRLVVGTIFVDTRY